MKIFATGVIQAKNEILRRIKNKQLGEVLVLDAIKKTAEKKVKNIIKFLPGLTEKTFDKITLKLVPNIEEGRLEMLACVSGENKRVLEIAGLSVITIASLIIFNSFIDEDENLELHKVKLIRNVSDKISKISSLSKGKGRKTRIIDINEDDLLELFEKHFKLLTELKNESKS